MSDPTPTTVGALRDPAAPAAETSAAVPPASAPTSAAPTSAAPTPTASEPAPPRKPGFIRKSMVIILAVVVLGFALSFPFVIEPWIVNQAKAALDAQGLELAPESKLSVSIFFTSSLPPFHLEPYFIFLNLPSSHPLTSPYLLSSLLSLSIVTLSLLSFPLSLCIFTISIPSPSLPLHFSSNLFLSVTQSLLSSPQCLGAKIGENVCLYPNGGDPMMTEPVRTC